MPLVAAPKKLIKFDPKVFLSKLRRNDRSARVSNVAVIDQPGWPAMDAETTPASMDFPTRQYRFEGFKAAAQLEDTFSVPSIDFTFKTDPLENPKCDFAVMGDEVNGKYYEATKG